MSVVGLFHDIHKWNRKNLTNYVEIYIKSSLTNIKKFDSRGVYKKKKVVGVDINKQIPKKPHIVIFNDFMKDQKFYAKKIFDKLGKIID